MVIIVVLEWTFSPPDFFEDEISVINDNYELKMKNGKIEVRVKPNIYDNDPEYREKLHAEIYNRFLAGQIVIHRPFSLSTPTMFRLHDDGRRDATAFPEGVALKFSGLKSDILVTSQNGDILIDTRRDRICKMQQLGMLAEKYIHRDETLKAILISYNRAVDNPENELFCLYEIRDAIQIKFGSKDTAIQAIGISNSKWRRLGVIANEAPLTQGRHRGKKVGILRDGTQAELDEAREISQQLVEGYLHYLDSREVF